MVSPTVKQKVYGHYTLTRVITTHTITKLSPGCTFVTCPKGQRPGTGLLQSEVHSKPSICCISEARVGIPYSNVAKIAASNFQLIAIGINDLKENAPMMVRQLMLMLLPPGSAQELWRLHHWDHWTADTLVGSLTTV